MKYILSTKDKNFQNNFKKVLNSKRRQSEANRSVSYTHLTLPTTPYV